MSKLWMSLDIMDVCVAQTQGAANAEALEYDVSFRNFAHPALSQTSIVGTVLGPLLFAANMFGFVAQARPGNRLAL